MIRNRTVRSLEVNGTAAVSTAPPTARLSSVLRNEFGLTGTKVGCDAGDCGACTVLVDDEAVCACLMPIAGATGRRVTTIEGLGSDGALHQLQASFLRHGAAQCGICTPGMLMAAAALLKRAPRPRGEQVEEALSGVLCRCTGYRKIVHAVTEAWREDGTVPSDHAQDRAGTAVGASLPRLDGVPKVAGTDRFGADETPDGALGVQVVRSPYHAARFTFGDLDGFVAARPGVVAVYTAADIPGRNRFGVIPPFADQPALADGTVRFRGEAVALVAGEPEAVAGLDADAVPIMWTECPHRIDLEDGRSQSVEPVHAERPDNVLTQGIVRRGDIDSALNNAAHIAEGTLGTGYVEHAYIEPEAGSAWIDGDTLVVRACTQGPHMDREALAEILGLPLSRVRVIPTATGGGFGSKLDLSVQPLIGLVALKVGRPARLVYTRFESMTSTTKRHPARMRARIGADREGRITGMWFEGEFNTGAYASWGPTVANRVPVHASGPYLTPAYEAVGRAVHTNGPVSGAFRGFGVPQATMLQETLYDDLAIAAGIDRLAFRRLNALRSGQTTVTGQTLAAGVGIGACLEALQRGWERALADAQIANRTAGHVRRGVGVASCWYGCGNTALPNPSTIRVGITRDGDVVLHQGAVDIGQGSNTVIAQICADALGLPVGAFRLIDADTDLTPDAGKTSASRQTYVSGNAARLAGSALRTAILRHANVSDEADLVLDGTRLVATDGSGSRTIDLGSLPAGSGGMVFRAEETYDPPTVPLDENGQGVPYAVYGYGAHMVELAVDGLLGTVRLLRITAAHDLGRVINPVLAEGQIEGGIAQGIGMALMEEYLPGRTENLHDYLVPTIGDVPEIETILIEEPDPEGPFGAKGLGEHALIPTAPAILNAIHHATGARITRAPATPARVLDAIQRVEVAS